MIENAIYNNFRRHREQKANAILRGYLTVGSLALGFILILSRYRLQWLTAELAAELSKRRIKWNELGRQFWSRSFSPDSRRRRRSFFIGARNYSETVKFRPPAKTSRASKKRASLALGTEPGICSWKLFTARNKQLVSVSLFFKRFRQFGGQKSQ